jgi:hypothetical protein
MIEHFDKNGEKLADISGRVISRADFPAVYALAEQITRREHEKGIADNPGDGAETDNGFRVNRVAN